MAHRIQSLMKSQNIATGFRAMSTKCSNFNDVQHSKNLHLAVQREYPEAANIELPPNVDPNEIHRFSPLRNRDINANAINVHHEISEIDVTVVEQKQTKGESMPSDDAHLRSYDKQGPINLSSTMQTLVPQPFTPPTDNILGSAYSSYLTFPGGNWGQQTKYLSHELNSAHYTELRQELRSDWSSYKGSIIKRFYSNAALLGPNFCLLNHNTIFTNTSQYRNIMLSCQNFNNNENQNNTKSVKETSRTKLKKAFKDNGATVVVFHVGISLISLGLFYTLVSSGLDVHAYISILLEKLNFTDKVPKIAENASTFIIAYAVHKVFAPVRISITLFSTPFIVRFLRNKKILK